MVAAERDAEAARLIDRYLNAPEAHGASPWSFSPASHADDSAVLDAAPAVQAACAALALVRTVELVGELETARHSPETWQSVSRVKYQPLYRLKGLLDVLLRRRLPFSAEEITCIARSFAAGGEAMWAWLQWLPMSSLLRAIESHIAANGLSNEVRAGLARFHAAGTSHVYAADERRMLARIGAILGVLQPAPHEIDTADDWGRAARVALDRMEAGTRGPWVALMAHAAMLTATRPAGPWRRRAGELVEAFGRERFVQEVAGWLGLLSTPASGGTRANAGGFSVSTALIAERNAAILKGLVWCCADCEDETVVRALGDAAEASFRKIPEVGARSVKVGNACIAVLGGMAGFEAVAQLQRLAQRVKQPSARSQIDQALSAAAARHGLSRDGLDDMAVPDFGLRDGRLRQLFGDYLAEVAVSGDDVTVRWMRQDGTSLRSEPSVVRRDFAAERAALKRTVGDLRQALPAQRSRLERTLLTERRWTVNDWRARVLDHPLVSPIARRLIWSFERPAGPVVGAWLDGGIVDVVDRPVADLTDDTSVSLWHPLDNDPAQVSAWRDWLDRHQITQPFKQAYREVYVLTDAERATETYSNRFAAHVIRQHQFKALCDQRGWRYSLQGGFDGHNVPAVDIPHVRMRAEFWVDALEGEDQLSAAGIALFVTTDQVRFYRLDRMGPLPLAEVPPRVFSELMRDVDLFVGVCSVGNDPTWQDGGPDLPGRFRDYWHDYAVGDLSASAEMRRVGLERLLPRLKIAGRCSLSDRFLLVRGDLRTYKIHLGSGNILMEPNNQYLCIVPGRGKALGRDDVFLPFEGDTMLSLILSKAFLLANDTAITDPTITSQIRRA